MTGFVRGFILAVIVLAVVGLGLWFELNSGDYLLIEKARNSRPPASLSPQPKK